MKYAEIIPLLRLPRSLEVFDYKIPDNFQAILTVGHAVLIQFRGRSVTGIVSAIKEKSQDATLAIDRLLDRVPFVNRDTLELLRECAHDTFVSPGLFLRHALPEIPKRASPSFVLPHTPKLSAPSTITRDLGEKLKTVLAALHEHQILHMRADSSHIVEPLLVRLAMESQSSRKPLLILLPIQEHAEALAKSLRNHGIPALCTLPTDAKIKTYNLWGAFRRGDAPVVVGTRNALFFPMPAGGRYVLIDETAEEWKQSEINPRLDVRTLLPKLAAHHDAQLLTITPQFALPFLDDRQEMGQFNMRIYESAQSTITTIPRAIIFSESLIAAMENKQNVLFFVHRKGKAALLRCRDCGWTAVCPTCDFALAVHRTFLRCTACALRQDVPLACPKCNSAELGTHGVGTEQVEEAAREAFPHACITVTTSSFLNQWPITQPTPQFDLVAIVEADTMLHRPDFRSQEKLGRIVNRLREIASANHSPLIIQTMFPELSIWAVGSDQEDRWIREELANRGTLHYPPSWRIAKLIIQHKDQKSAAAEALKTHTVISNAVRNSSVEVAEPTPATPPKVRGKYHFIVIVRFKPEQYQSIKPHLATLPDDIVIDLDPTDILR